MTKLDKTPKHMNTEYSLVKINVRKYLSILLALLVINLSFPFNTFAAPSTTISLAPTATTVSVNESFSSNVQVNTGTNSILSADIVFTFDSSVLEVVDVTLGSFLPGAQEIKKIIDNTNGKVTYSLYTTLANARSGQGTLATVTWRGKGGGTSQVAFDNNETLVYGVGEGNVVSSLTGATYTVNAPAPQPAPASTGGGGGGDGGGGGSGGGGSSSGGGGGSSGPSGGGLTGSYYNNSNFTDFKFSRTDPHIAFNWGRGSPDGRIDKDTFSVAWTGSLYAPHTGTYTFYFRSDDGARVYVNNRLIINRFRRGAGEPRGTINLNQGERVPIRIEYFEYNLRSFANLSWSVVAVRTIPVLNARKQPVLRRGKPLTRTAKTTVIRKSLVPFIYLSP